jgi:hypothetical protein
MGLELPYIQLITMTFTGPVMAWKVKRKKKVTSKKHTYLHTNVGLLRWGH